MRWDDLFADLAADAAGLELADRDTDIAERTRGEWGRLTLVDRCRGAIGHELRVEATGAGPVAGRLVRLTPLWLLLEPAGPGPELVVALDAVQAISDLPPRSAASPQSVVEASLSWAQTWRALARDRAEVTVVRTDGQMVTGLVHRSGADAVDLRVRTEAAGASMVTVPHRAVAVVRCPR